MDILLELQHIIISSHATIKHIKEWFTENGYLQDIDQRNTTSS
uniref:Uncharacterized protein n=1 Tax=Cucumis melo TaxID=3656 RepID=A0A9I9E7V3_CUCME